MCGQFLGLNREGGGWDLNPQPFNMKSTALPPELTSSTNEERHRLSIDDDSVSMGSRILIFTKSKNSVVGASN